MTATAAAFPLEPTLQPTVMSAELSGNIQECFKAYRGHSGAVKVALLDPSGAVLVNDLTDLPGVDLDTISVLVTASFGANQQLAQHLGDRTFGGICHQGTDYCLYAAPLTKDFILLGLFGADANLGKIRQSLVRIIPRLNQLLAPPAPEAISGPFGKVTA